MASKAGDGIGGGVPWRLVGWGLAAALLSVPAIAMRFTREVSWTASDFIVMGVLIGGVGLAIEGATRLSRDPWYRAGAVVALGAAFLLIWVNLAVGMIGSEDDAYNFLFVGVIAVAFGGGAIGRFRAAAMARATAVAGVAQILVAGLAYSADPRGAVFSVVLAAPWLVAAALFRRAARSS